MEFEETYYNFIKQMRNANPEAEILCILGVIGSGLYNFVNDAVKKYKEILQITKFML